MNFLGHAYFSPDDYEILAGNVFGDFVKGRIENTNFPAGIKNGLKLHRKIDTVCNESEGYHLIKQTIGKDYGHFNGVIADIFIDHFLSIYWEDFSDVTLEAFAESTFNKIEIARSYFPERFEYVFNYMKTDNWFVRNKDINNIENILIRIENKFGKGQILHTSVNNIKANPRLFKEHFYQFIEEMKEGVSFC
jgi:acyl carrier protein phosphodiesterase